MNLFEEKDYGLIAEAKKAIRLNYDQDRCYHTVGAAVKNGTVIDIKLYALLKAENTAAACVSDWL